jgi:hypothetical protein
VHPNVPWMPSPTLQRYDEFDPYEGLFNADIQQRADGPVVPVPWFELSIGDGSGGGGTSASRGSSPQNGSTPSDPFSIKRKRGFSFKKVRRFFSGYFLEGLNVNWLTLYFYLLFWF